MPNAIEHEVRDRAGLREYIDRVLRRDFAGAAPSLQLKTYMFDVHSPEGRPPLDVARQIARAQGGSVRPTDDPTIVLMSARPRRKGGGLDEDSHQFVVDAFDERFWLVHTSGETPRVSRIHEQMQSVPWVDRAWLPPSMLFSRNTPAWRRLGLRIRFDDRQLLYGPTPSSENTLDEEREVEPEADEDDAACDDLPDVFGRDLRAEVNNDQAARLVANLLDLQDGATAPVESALFESRDCDGAGRVKARVYAKGRFVATGASSSAFIAFLSWWHREYAAKVREIEREFRHGDGIGRPVNIAFSQPVPNLRMYVAGLLSCTHPFRLWGVPDFSGDEFARVRAVDLHVRQPLYLEISPERMRIYLDAQTCGNVVTRLYTNIIGRQDWGARIYTDSDAEPLL